MILLETHVAGGLATEMAAGTLERLFTMPVHRLSLVLGIAIYYLVLFCYQSITLFAGAALLVGFEPAVTAGGLLQAALALLLLLALNLFLGIAAAGLVMAFKDHTVSVLLFHRPMAMLSGAYFLVELIPNPFRWLACVNPVAWAIDLFRGTLTGTTLLATFGGVRDGDRRRHGRRRRPPLRAPLPAHDGPARTHGVAGPVLIIRGEAWHSIT